MKMWLLLKYKLEFTRTRERERESLRLCSPVDAMMFQSAERAQY